MFLNIFYEITIKHYSLFKLWANAFKREKLSTASMYPMENNRAARFLSSVACKGF